MENRPRTSSQDAQSRAVTAAALLRYIVERLKITGVTVPDPDGGRPHDLRRLLNSFIHYERFYPVRMKPQHDGTSPTIVNLKSRRGKEYRVSLEDYFAVVERFARDDAFMAHALLERVVTMLHRLAKESGSPDEDFSSTLGSLVMDTMELLHTMDTQSRIDIPDTEMDGWLAETVEVEGRWGSEIDSTTARFRDLVKRYSNILPNDVFLVRSEERLGLVYMLEYSRRPRDSYIFEFETWLGAFREVQSAMPTCDP